MKTTSNTDLALLLIRVALTLVFLAHGWNTFIEVDVSVWGYVIAVVEVVGSLFMLAGIFTGWTGIALSIVVLTGNTFDVTLFLSALAISLAGPGAYTFRYVFKKK